MPRRTMATRVFLPRVFATWALRGIQGPVGQGWTVQSKIRLAVAETRKRVWVSESKSRLWAVSMEPSE